MTYDNFILNEQAIFDEKNVLFIECKSIISLDYKLLFQLLVFNFVIFRFRGFSQDKAIIIFNNQFFVVHPKHIEQKLLLESWKESYFSWYLYKFRHFNTDLFNGCVYFTTWTYLFAIRVK